MTDAGFFKGTSADQDSRFSDKNKKLMKTMKFADNLEKKIDMRKIQLELMKPFIANKLNSVMPIEDDVIIEYVFSQLEETQYPDGRSMQIMMTGFLGKTKARSFMGELWNLLVDAQESPHGIPPELIEMKKSELIKKKEDEIRINASLNKSKDEIERCLNLKDKQVLSSRKEQSTQKTSPPRSNKDVVESKSKEKPDKHQPESQTRHARSSRSPSNRHKEVSKRSPNRSSTKKIRNDSSDKEDNADAKNNTRRFTEKNDEYKSSYSQKEHSHSEISGASKDSAGIREREIDSVVTESTRTRNETINKSSKSYKHTENTYEENKSTSGGGGGGYKQSDYTSGSRERHKKQASRSPTPRKVAESVKSSIKKRSRSRSASSSSSSVVSSKASFSSRSSSTDSNISPSKNAIKKRKRSRSSSTSSSSNRKNYDEKRAEAAKRSYKEEQSRSIAPLQRILQAEKKRDDGGGGAGRYSSRSYRDEDRRAYESSRRRESPPPRQRSRDRSRERSRERIRERSRERNRRETKEITHESYHSSKNVETKKYQSSSRGDEASKASSDDKRNKIVPSKSESISIEVIISKHNISMEHDGDNKKTPTAKVQDSISNSINESTSESTRVYYHGEKKTDHSSEDVKKEKTVKSKKSKKKKKKSKSTKRSKKRSDSDETEDEKHISKKTTKDGVEIERLLREKALESLVSKRKKENI